MSLTLKPTKMMNKYLSMIATAGAALLTACGGTNTTTTDQPDSSQLVVAEQARPDTTLALLVEQAKAEGASWTTDQWRAQFDKVLRAYKPYAVALNELTAAMESAGGDVKLIVKQSELIDVVYAGYDQQMQAFMQVAEASPNGKAVADDEQWLSSKMHELGVPRQ